MECIVRVLFLMKSKPGFHFLSTATWKIKGVMRFCCSEFIQQLYTFRAPYQKWEVTHLDWWHFPPKMNKNTVRKCSLRHACSKTFNCSAEGNNNNSLTFFLWLKLACSDFSQCTGILSHWGNLNIRVIWKHDHSDIHH